MIKKNVILTSVAIFLGIAIGIIIKVGTVIPQGTTLAGILWAIGNLGSGFFIWTAICTMLVMLSKSKKLAAINVFVFLASMIIANYLYSYFVTEWFVLRVAVFWVIMLILCTFLGYYIWDIKTNKKIYNIKLKNIIITIGTAIMLFDLLYMGLMTFASTIIIIIILYVGFLTSIRFASKNIKDK